METNDTTAATGTEGGGTEGHGTAAPEQPADPTRRNPVVIAVSIAIPVLLVAGVLYGASRISDSTGASQTDALSAVTVPSPDAGSEKCTALLDALPDALGDAKRVEFTDPAPAAAAGYRMGNGAPIVVRCGLPAPEGFEVGTALTAVDDVQWFDEPDPVAEVTDSTWVAVDRGVYIAVTLPEESGTGPIQALSDVITATLPAVDPTPAPASPAGPQAPAAPTR